MSWQDQLKGDSLSWLLEPDSPGVRYLAWRDLLDRPKDDPELRAAQRAAHAQGPIATILAEMNKAGYWVEPGPGYNPKYRSTVWAIIMLAQLGAAAAYRPGFARHAGPDAFHHRPGGGLVYQPCVTGWGGPAKATGYPPPGCAEQR